MSDRPHLPVGRARSRRIYGCRLQMREVPHPYRPILSIEWVLRPAAAAGERRDVMSKRTVFQRWERANQLRESRNARAVKGAATRTTCAITSPARRNTTANGPSSRNSHIFAQVRRAPLEPRIRMTLCRPFIRRGGPPCAFRMGLENDSTGEIS